MNLGELSDKLPSGDDIRREFDHLVGRLPSRGEVRARVSDLPAAAQRWLPSRHEPAWSDALTAKNVAVFGVGMALGAGLAALLSPRSGPALRRDLIARVQRLREAGLSGKGTSSPARARASRDDGNGTGARPDLSH